MTREDIPAADALRALAGWNQTAQDWRRFLDAEPGGCFVAECDGATAGTATTICYGTELAWIGMVLVHPEYRRRGIGTALLEHCLEHLRARGIRCIKLDATPEGRMVYEQLGFRDEWGLTRWEHPSAPPAQASAEASTRSVCDADWTAIRRLDAEIFGVERLHVLAPLAAQSLSVRAHPGGHAPAGGFGMIREGSRALYLGPVTASNVVAGLALVRALLGYAAGRPVFWDIPDDNAEATRLAVDLGFARQRGLMRMFLGENRRPGDPRRMFGIVAPEMG